jgi:hypothetical protein
VLRWVAGLGLAVVLVLGIVAHPDRSAEGWERFPAFEALFGLLGCLAIILVSKALGHVFIQKREDYYDE